MRYEMTINWNPRNSKFGGNHYYEIPGFQPGTFGVWDQRTTTALFLSLSSAAKKLVFTKRAYNFVKRTECSGSAVEWSKKWFRISILCGINFHIVMPPAVIPREFPGIFFQFHSRESVLIPAGNEGMTNQSHLTKM